MRALLLPLLLLTTPLADGGSGSGTGSRSGAFVLPPSTGHWRSHHAVGGSADHAARSGRPALSANNLDSARPSGLTEVQRQEAMNQISPAMIARHTAKDGSVDFKALSKLVPLRADSGELEVLLEDDNLIVVSKPQGMAMNPPHRFLNGTLINRMLGYLGGEKPPYVLHRLDMWTSGAVVFSKNKTLVPLIHRLFRERQVLKDYLCLVDGVPSAEQAREGSFLVDAPIDKDLDCKIMRKVDRNGQLSQTVFDILAVSTRHQMSLLRAKPLTGRTHQIRVHARHAGLPIVGDNVYGREASLYASEDEMLSSEQKAFPGEAAGARIPLKLHARRLRFTRPDLGVDLDVTAPLPAHFASALATFGFDWHEDLT
jgi:RluA family pseudouridine synthase